MIHENGTDKKTYCYIRVEPLLLNNIYDIDAIAAIKNNNPFDPPFGIKKAFINNHGDLQIKSSYLAIVGCDKYTKKNNKILALYNGHLLVVGVIREWSKSPIESKVSTFQKYKILQTQIDELKEKQRELMVS